MEQQTKQIRYISEIENDLKVLLNGSRGEEQAKQFKVLLKELEGFMPYVTTKYIKQFITNSQNTRFILRDFLSKADLTTEKVLSQLKQEWVFVKYETEIKNYMLSDKLPFKETSKIKVGKAYLKYSQDVLRKIINKPLNLLTI